MSISIPVGDVEVTEFLGDADADFDAPAVDDHLCAPGRAIWTICWMRAMLEAKRAMMMRPVRPSVILASVSPISGPRRC